MIQKIWRLWFHFPAWKQIFFALCAGILVGWMGGHHALILEPIGTIFIRAIRMIIVPIVFFSIMNALMDVRGWSIMRRLACKALVVYLLCMLCATGIGLFLAHWMHPGSGLTLPIHETVRSAASAAPTFSDFIIHCIPENPVRAFYDGNIAQILVFSLLLGAATQCVTQEAESLSVFFKIGAQISIRLASLIMSFAPYGIFALIACVVGQYGLLALWPLLKFVGCVYLGCIILLFLYSILAYWLLSYSPLVFLKNALKPMVVAFTTSSSAATLPVTLRCAEEEFHIPSHIARFLLPLGTSLNLNGLSVYLAVATVFAANIYGIDLSWSQYGVLLLTIVVTSVGAGAVPGTALVVMGAIQSSVGIPLGAIPLIAGVDRLNDMMQTCTNVASDLFSTAVISRSEDVKCRGS